MRLVFVVSASEWSGRTGSTLDVALGLAGAGHEVTLACHPGGEIHGRLGDDTPLTVVPIAFGSEMNPYRALQLASLYRRSQPHAVLAGQRRDVKLSVAAGWLHGGFPVLFHHVSLTELGDSHIDKHFWRRAQVLIAESFTVRERLSEVIPWLEGHDIEVIYDGKDLQRFRPLPKHRGRMRSELGIPEEAFVVSFHGTLEDGGNVELLIKAVSEVPQHLGVYALIVGTGPALSDARRLAAELRAPVIFAPPREQTPEVLSAADASAQLSTTEGFSGSMIEALACGLPLIQSDAVSPPDRVEDGEQGVLVPSGRWQGIVDAIRWLAGDPEGRARMAAASRERALALYSRERMIESYESVLQAAVQSYSTDHPDRNADPDDELSS